MRLILFLLIFCSCSTLKTYAPSAGLAFVSGASHGTAEILQHKNHNFFERFPNADRNFFGSDSWLNKYKQRKPELGRNRTPIWFTDGLHLTRSVSHVSAFGSGVFILSGKKPKRPFLHYSLKLGASFAAYTAGNYLTYNVFFQ